MQSTFLQPNVRILPLREGMAESVRTQQFEDVALSLIELCGQEKPYQLKDAAILIPSRGHLPSLMSSLQHYNIPFRLMMDAEILDTQEACDLRAILRYLADVSDLPALYGALRSAGFGCVSQDLYDLSKEGGGYAATAKEQLLQWRERVSNKSMVEVVSYVFEESRAVLVALAGARARESINRWKRLIAIASEFDKSKGGTIAEFSLYLEVLTDENIRHKGSVVLEEDYDAVSIYTVQAAKGLEFPIVACCCLSNTAKYDDYPRVGTLNRSIVWALNKSVTSQNAGAYLEAQKKARELEELRLAYVATTRARDILIVSLSTPDKSSNTVAHDIREIPLPLPIHMPPPAKPMPLPIQATVEPYDFSTIQDLKRDAALKTIASSQLGGSLYATEVVDFDQDSRGQLSIMASDEGIRFGRAFHTLMLMHDLTKPMELHQVKTFARQETVEGRLGDLIQAEKVALRFLQPVLGNATTRKECFISASIEGGLLEGYIDLLVQDGTAAHIIDYKTDKVHSQKELMQRVDHYSMQAGAYAYMLSKAGLTVSSVRFLFVLASGLSSETEAQQIIEGEALLKLALDAKERAEDILANS